MFLKAFTYFLLLLIIVAEKIESEAFEKCSILFKFKGNSAG
jgi:hypothetical protein